MHVTDTLMHEPEREGREHTVLFLSAPQITAVYALLRSKVRFYNPKPQYYDRM